MSLGEGFGVRFREVVGGGFPVEEREEKKEIERERERGGDREEKRGGEERRGERYRERGWSKRCQ